MLRWWRRIRSLLLQTDPGGATGRRGERFAAQWLSDRGYRILDRNFTIGRDEVDLLALAPDRRTIVLVEVKTRTGDFAPPEEAVNARKRFRLARGASKLHRLRAYRDRPLRFDVIAIVWRADEQPQVRHFEGAFESPF